MKSYSCHHPLAGMRPKVIPAARRAAQAGFTLVELMIASLMGLLTAMVIFQVYATFEGQKRTTVSGGEALQNALFGLDTMTEDLAIAGYGITADAMLACTTYFAYSNSTNAAIPASEFTATPLIITDGGTGSDSITIRYSGGSSGQLHTTLSVPIDNNGDNISVASTAGFNDGDLALVSQNGNCMLVQITNIVNTPGVTQFVTNRGNSGFNPSVAVMNAATPPWPYQSYTAGAKIFSLGRYNNKVYSVVNENLQVQEWRDTSTSAIPAAITIAAGIVQLQAQYGMASAETNSNVDCWVNATNGGNTGCSNAGDNARNWTPNAITTTEARRMRAVRFAIVARSNQYEKTVVTANNPAWTSAAGSGISIPMANPADGTDWQRYRYRTYEIAVPLRNMLWSEIVTN